MNLTPIRTPRCVGLAALVGISLLGGCTSQRDLVAAGRLTLEPKIDHALRQPPDVYEESGELVVAGRLERGLPRDSGGHIDITVIAPDGATVYDAQLNYRADTASSAGTPNPRHGSFRRAHTRYGSYGVYSVRFPGLPPDGSVVRVRYESGIHPASGPKP
jgi:hypothetical protein